VLKKLCRFIYLSCGAPRSWVLNSYGTSSAQARPGQDHNLLVSMQNFHAKSFGERRIDSIAVINTPSSLSYPQLSPPRPVKTPLSTWFTHLSSNTSGKVSTSPTSSEGRWRVSKHRHPHCRIAPGVPTSSQNTAPSSLSPLQASPSPMRRKGVSRQED
jgi:hypothetical protein